MRRLPRAFWWGLKGFLSPDPAPLRTMLYRVILLAILAPMALLGWVEARQDAKFDERVMSLEAAADRPENSIPPGAVEEMKEIILGPHRGFGEGGGALSEPLQTQEFSDRELAQLKSRGYAYGQMTWPGGKGPYAAWRTNSEHFRVVYTVPAPWWESLFGWAIGLAIAVAILSLFASPAAWYLERRIARPVRQVAEASTVMAAGDYPMPLPSKGPRELVMMADSFNLMAAKLEKAQAVEKEFLLSVSHELKTPLTAIEGYAELLAEGAVTGEEAGLVVQSETVRLRRLVSDLLDLARLHQSTFSIHREVVDLGAAARTAVQRHLPLAREAGIELKAVTPDIAPVEADEDRLLQVASNLVENALRCTPAGGSVTVKAENGSLVVQDSGSGISPEDLPRVFERFYLYRRYNAERSVGSGLGLALVSELVQMMGGSVAVESLPGHGTTFSVRLPPAAEAEAPT